MVGISFIPILLAYELMPRHFAHGREQAFIADSPLAQLAFHHGEALRRKRLCAIAIHASLFVPAYVDVKAQHPVLVTHRYDRDVLINIVFHLNHRLSGLREAGDVSKSNVIADLLFNRHARAGIVFRADKLWINFYPARAKKPLYAVTEGGIERFAQDRV